MNTDFINEIAATIASQIPMNNITMCWGMEKFRAIYVNGCAGLSFNVNGFLHKGQVNIIYQEGADLYDILYLDNKGKEVLPKDERIYFDQLVEVIDYKVEKNTNDDEYRTQVNTWLNYGE